MWIVNPCVYCCTPKITRRVLIAPPVWLRNGGVSTTATESIIRCPVTIVCVIFVYADDSTSFETSFIRCWHYIRTYIYTYLCVGTLYYIIIYAGDKLYTIHQYITVGCSAAATKQIQSINKKPLLNAYSEKKHTHTRAHLTVVMISCK